MADAEEVVLPAIAASPRGGGATAASVDGASSRRADPMDDWRDAVETAAECRKRLAKVQRQIARQAQLEALEEARERKLAIRASDPSEESKVLAMLADVQPASENQMRSLSHSLNARLSALTNSKALGTHATWYSLFKAVDIDGSGTIGFNEFRRLLRSQLRLSTKQLPEATLQALWKALDLDQSGWVSAGEWGRFMRREQPSPPPRRERCNLEDHEVMGLNGESPPRRPLHAMRRGRVKAVASASAGAAKGDEANGVVTPSKEGARASDKELDALSRRFNAALGALGSPDRPAEWYKLFKRTLATPGARLASHAARPSPPSPSRSPGLPLSAPPPLLPVATATPHPTPPCRFCAQTWTPTARAASLTTSSSRCAETSCG